MMASFIRGHLGLVRLGPAPSASLLLLLMATMDASSHRAGAAEPPLQEPEPPVLWTAETNPHAQRILRLESRRTAGPAPLR